MHHRSSPTLAVISGSAIAEEAVSESRAVDARVVKVELGGVIDLQLKQDATPSLTLHGDRQDVTKVVTTQHGGTLRIDTDDSYWNRGNKRKLRAELTLPNLSEFTSHGVGATNVQGFSGEQVTLSLDGAGARYKNIKARLGGVGSTTVNAGDTDQVDLNMRGAGHLAINGQSKMLRVKLGGVGSLDAKALESDAVELDLTGVGGATVYARNLANLRLKGLGYATVYGKPANRNAIANGMGRVSWQ